MPPPDERKGFTKVFAEVFLSELGYLKGRRKALDLEWKDVDAEHGRLSGLVEGSANLVHVPNRVAPQTDIRPSASAGLVGLALSGGGIRSATFNLGMLQGLARRGVLRCCDYLSTVSGGGYIGSCLSSLLNDTETSVEKDKFPFRFQRKEKPDERRTVKHLREHGSFLAPKGSFLEYTRMLGTYLTGLILSNLFPVAVLIYFGWGVHLLINMEGFAEYFHDWCFGVSLGAVALMVIIRGYGATCKRELDIDGRRRAQYINAVLAGLLVLSAGLGLAAVLARYWGDVKEWLVSIVSGVSIASALGLIAGVLQSKNEKVRTTLGAFFRIGWILALPVLFTWLLTTLAALDAYKGDWLFVTIGIAAVLFLASMAIDTNRVSLHHFYRDRLSEAYIIKDDRGNNRIVPNELLRLSELHRQNNGAPYHLINTTLNVPGSADPYLRGRGADIFFFSRNYVGSEATGYRASQEYLDGGIRLATAMAISGAAASPQMGTSTKKILRAVLTLLNVRLNRWMPNPNPAFYRRKTVFWPWYFIKELLGVTKESDNLLNLSDGGHHENLGIYPLLKRRCRVIIASDATADPKFAMNDLANVIRKARIDLGISVDIRVEDLHPDPETGLSSTCCAVGDIHYPAENPDEAKGTLIYIKSAITGNLPEDLQAYRRKHPSFPDETTGDQFFDEAQFESYRKLGEEAALAVFMKPLKGRCLSDEDMKPIRDAFASSRHKKMQEAAKVRA